MAQDSALDRRLAPKSSRNRARPPIGSPASFSTEWPVSLHDEAILADELAPVAQATDHDHLHGRARRQAVQAERIVEMVAVEPGGEVEPAVAVQIVAAAARADERS